ncbi:MAG: peptidoglycan editing factor PgeF [bacterium]
MFKQRGDIGYFVCPALEGFAVHGFSTRIPSSGRRNAAEEIYHQKQRFYSTLQIKAPSLLHIQQVHGDRIFVARDPVGQEAPGEYDGAVTDSTGIALSIVTADCLPILIYEHRKKIIGAVHAGWKGTALGILRNALTAIRQSLGGSLQDCIILLGPSLRPCCFEIQHDVLEILKARLTCWSEVIREVQDKIYFDLQLANVLQAREMGVLEEGIWALDLCTFCRPEWFHSYRRDKGQTGRMISMISLI